jgi:tetratricopeptide (TPR) repeat protein
VSFPVFISYSRRTSTAEAQALAERLDDLAFLDTGAIEDGASFPERLLDAILDASVVVIFATAGYTETQFCRLEMHLALAAGDQSGSHLVLALGEGYASVLEALPAAVARRNWPAHADTEHLEALIRQRLLTNPPALRDRLTPDEAKRLSIAFLNESGLPEPQSLAGIRCSMPPGFALASIGARFAGRANLLRNIHQILFEGLRTGAYQVVRLTAGGGFGKTRVAIEYLSRYGPYYPGGIFWVDASSRVLEGEFWRVLSALDPSVPPLATMNRERRDLRRELGHALLTIGEPALYVIDNIPETDPGADPPRIGDFCPVPGAVSIIATSRQDTQEENVRTLSMDVLDRDSAILLLTENLHGAAAIAWADWGRIAGWVGDLPVVLDLLNRSLALSAISPHWLLDRIGMKDQQPGMAVQLDSLRDALRGKVPENAVRGVTEVFSISFQKLDRVTRKTAQLLAHLATAPIPEDFMRALPETWNRPAVRAALHSHHFLSAGDGLSFGVMHSLLADFLRSMTGSKLPEVLEWGCAAIEQIMPPERSRDPRHWPLMILCRTHAEMLLSRSLAAERQRKKRPVAHWIWRAMLSWAGMTNTLFTRSFGVYTMTHASIFMGLRTVVFVSEQGDNPGAKRLLAQILEMSLRVLGEHHVYTLVAMNNLAMVLRNEGDYEEARRHLDRLVQVMARTLGQDHPETVNSMLNLASTLRDLAEYEAARRLQERVLEITTRLGGEQDPATLRTLNDLALTVQAHGDHAGAKRLLQRVLEAATRSFGEEHPDTLAAMNNLGTSLRDEGDYAAAKQLQDRLVEITTRVLGEEHPHTLTAKGNLALTLMLQGDGSGHQLLQGVLDSSSRVLGADHPNTLMWMHHLALSVRAQGDRERAQQMLEQVRDLRKRVLGEEHPHTLASVKELSNL